MSGGTYSKTLILESTPGFTQLNLCKQVTSACNSLLSCLPFCRYMSRPVMSCPGLYDPTTIMNADILAYCQKEGWCKLAFYLLSFFYYLYGYVFHLYFSALYFTFHLYLLREESLRLRLHYGGYCLQCKKCVDMKICWSWGSFVREADTTLFVRWKVEAVSSDRRATQHGSV